MRFPHRLACIVFLFGLVLFSHATESGPPKPAPDARFGNWLYKTPDPARWTMSERADRRVFAAKLPPPDFCTLTVFTGGQLEGDFAAAFERAIAASLRELRSEKIERDGGAQTSKAAEGFDVLQRIVVAEAPDFHTYHWFLAGHSGERFDLIAFQTSSEEIYRQYSQDAGDFFYSVKLANSLPATAAPPPPSQSQAASGESTRAARFGPIAVGDHVEVPWGGSWIPGVVLHIEGLTYFVHYGSEADKGTYDDFFTLNLLRPPGGPQTFAETFRGTLPDPEGGPIALGANVEYNDGRWLPARMARRLGERYVVFADKPGIVTEKWLTPDKLRAVGSATPFAAERPFRQRQPAIAADIRVADLVEAHPRRGFWGQLTVFAQEGANYFVKIGPDSGPSMRGWVDLSHMRPVGAKDPFQPEDLTFFVGHWKLTGDSFQNLIDRKVSGGKVTETYQNNSGAGQGAGDIAINADGTYQLRNTVVFHDGKGRWERNPNQEEGGILLHGADGTGEKDCLVTNHLDGFGYLQGSIRGPGKWCTRVGQ